MDASGRASGSRERPRGQAVAGSPLPRRTPPSVSPHVHRRVADVCVRSSDVSREKEKRHFLNRKGGVDIITSMIVVIVMVRPTDTDIGK
ncbi:hypothetical protein F2P81_023014 [Scophthalmus maximus]|uniref:Uncharacterized protein n=1 Tax=Scophthalmus maximus TaxID=52904 RepID=A0A6A4RYH9_SCOMX|nr:hypothetical protein F2P81_023014 [Scophthalmus maximus]